MIISLSDTYEVRREGKGTKKFDFAFPEDISKKDKRYIRDRYRSIIKEVKRVFEKGYARKIKGQID